MIRRWRNRGTLGGSLANNDPAADYPAVALALGATVFTNKRKISADDFFTGMFETALGRGEMVTQVLFPIPQRAGYAKFPNPATRYALVGVCVAQFKTGVRVAVTGAGPSVYRLPDFEAALSEDFSPGALDGLSASAANLNDDMHAGSRVPRPPGGRNGPPRPSEWPSTKFPGTRTSLLGAKASCPRRGRGRARPQKASNRGFSP